MRADRLITIILLLQKNHKLTTKELAMELEVAERTIHRDMEALSSAGIPVYAERGRGGGWSIVEGYRTSLTGLKESEIRTLFISPSTQLLDDLGMTQSSQEARNKLIASLPAIYSEKVKDVWNRIHVDMSTWHKQKENIASFDLLKNAIWNNNKLQMVYERADGQANERIVNPLGLVAKGNRWYFIAARENDEIRNYRASRILSAKSIEETFERPRDFNLVQYWESSTKTFIENLPKYEVQAQVMASSLPRLKFSSQFVQVTEYEDETDDEWISVKLTFDTEIEARRYVLGFSDHIKVIEPNEFRNIIVEMAKRVVAFYEENGTWHG